jgi:AcrR family transcriptional regulator
MCALLPYSCQTADVTETPASGVRARARAEMTSEIKRIALQHLAVDGPNLSLRAVARELGVVSSAVYRYFASRDELLTALIIDAYDSLGEACEQAEAAVDRRDLHGRWMALGLAVRAWALAHPHEYALTYGSPIPGYAAPQDTIGPASRPVWIWVAIIRDGVEAGTLKAGSERLGKALRKDLDALAGSVEFTGVPAAVISRGLTVWAQLFGALSFELFGRLTNAIVDYDAFFEHQLLTMASYLGLDA